MKTDKPWGYEFLFAHTDKYAGKILFVRAGERLSLQYHEKKDETLYIYSGEVLVIIDKNPIILTLGQIIHIPPLTKHRIHALKDTTIFEVSTPELDDVVRFDDDYGRRTGD